MASSGLQVTRIEKTVTISSIPYYTLLESPSLTSSQNISSPPSRPLILLIHALMSNHHIWDSTVTFLHGLGYRTLRYDHIGHNRTSPPLDPSLAQPGPQLNFDVFCAHIHTIIASTVGPGVEPAGIIGCSIGGVLTLRYAMLYPSSMTRYISCAAPGLTTLSEAKPKWLERIAKWRVDGSNHELAVQTVDRWFHDPVDPSFNRIDMTKVLETTSLQGYEICAWATMNFNYTGELHRLKGVAGNVLVVRGQTDVSIGPKEVLVDVARRIGCILVEMRQTGHIPPLHWPTRFEALVGGWLQNRVVKENESEWEVTRFDGRNE